MANVRIEDGVVILTLANGESLPEVRVEIVAPKPVNTFAAQVLKARVPCAYGSKSCEGVRFAPNGVGSKQHTTCEKGHKAMIAARTK